MHCRDLTTAADCVYVKVKSLMQSSMLCITILYTDYVVLCIYFALISVILKCVLLSCYLNFIYMAFHCCSRMLSIAGNFHILQDIVYMNCIVMHLYYFPLYGALYVQCKFKIFSAISNWFNS